MSRGPNNREWYLSLNTPLFESLDPQGKLMLQYITPRAEALVREGEVPRYFVRARARQKEAAMRA